MSNLTVIKFDGKYVAHSKDVAEMIGKQHKDLLETIRGYIDYLTSGEFRSSDFFMSYEYADAKGELRPCYWLTRKGCDMVANKMTGEKGVLFTAAYVTKFEEMEKAQNQPLSQIQILQQAINVMAEQEKKLTAIEGTVQTIKDTIITQPDNWRDDLNKMFNKIVISIGENKFRDLRTESYKLLEQRARVDLSRRLIFYKARLEQQGISKTKVGQANKLDVIEQDAKLREIYTQIVKEYFIAHCA